MTTLISEDTEKKPEEFGVESLLTIQQAAKALGVHTWALRRAVNTGSIPAYAPFNGRKLVRLSEVIAAINASKIGGKNV
ncbi:helix-turn-helix domain-containing protein [Roseibium aggregatum]|uniref:Helix-turn-helix domain-containing protein n=1 Tax=Roseibium aggregatum TaxID=187304 RepID=A0A939J6M9_9HYPH|nr:helix-turn-helix domain-containing protein [Roseibium aggregatum]MBN9673455.1 helix-turn-helix domain-containing protein [Roseibium aggregatum]